MLAAVYRKYGPPEVISIEEVDTPACGDHDILVKVMTTTVNSGDVKLRSMALPLHFRIIARLIFGMMGPRRPIPGLVFAGIVEKTGNKVTRFEKGQRVFGMTGMRFGTCAQFIAMPEQGVVASMPSSATFEEAASLPFGWHTAIHFLHKAGIQKLSKPSVLVIGGGGSVGAAAVQLAKYYGATVTTVCSSESLERVNIFGADEVICYDKKDFTKTAERFDIIFDASGKYNARDCKRLLRSNGMFRSVDSMESASEKTEHLHLISDLFEKGLCKPNIDKIFPLTHIVDAHAYVESGRKKGDVVITIDHLK